MHYLQCEECVIVKASDTPRVSVREDIFPQKKDFLPRPVCSLLLPGGGQNKLILVAFQLSYSQVDETINPY